ncbi:putative receptor protein kinase ZmPK1 [Morella rubra]|uniref:non-specific serine/threonine protein kinase n=1 Tax=Morella rubra TaxID=262757 RepID=A0A6A1W507_9ROSI|nr:putative receptor protein kinase ZmPK1 [Morella rubra]
MKSTRTLLLCVLSLALFAPPASTFPSLSKGSSLSSEKPKDVLTSPNGVFSAGFYPVGENAYCFAIWFTKLTRADDLVVVWMANRDQPVNGRRSKLSLLDTGDLILTDAGFRKFTYAELKKATKGFTEEIGRGAGGIVYRGVLSNNRVAAVKRLNVANRLGEDTFLAEVSIIGRLNPMHLIEMWGYCAQGKHRLLVSEYMEHGSLAQNLASIHLIGRKGLK